VFRVVRLTWPGSSIAPRPVVPSAASDSCLPPLARVTGGRERERKKDSWEEQKRRVGGGRSDFPRHFTPHAHGGATKGKSGASPDAYMSSPANALFSHTGSFCGTSGALASSAASSRVESRSMSPAASHSQSGSSSSDSS
jgi:hypothetical protein